MKKIGDEADVSVDYVTDNEDEVHSLCIQRSYYWLQ